MAQREESDTLGRAEEKPSAADLELLLLIRRFEERLLHLFAEGHIGGTTHTCLGQEYIPVAMAPLLQEDVVFSNHRGHGHYLAHGGDPESLLAEILGREGAVCRGVGGSQHLRRERFISTGVQGESLPMAAGMALHFRHMGQPRIAVSYIGDGTWGEGAVYEALNVAQLWGLPLLVLVEHNGIAQSTPTDRQMAGTVAGRATAFGIGCDEIVGTDVVDIRRRLAARVHQVRAERKPHVVVFQTVRLGPHSKGDDSRSPAELDALRATDWLVRYADHFPDQIRAADARARARIDAAVTDVLARPPSTWLTPKRLHA
jgi:pyruvate dehydrogenase E1 component alpha subunit